MTLATAAKFAVANWPLNEASGGGMAKVGDALTSNNGVDAGDGKLFQLARSFDGARQQSLSVTSDGVALGDEDWTIRYWLRLTANPPTNGAACIYKWGSIRDYASGVNTSLDPFIAVSADGLATQGRVLIHFLGSPISIGQWTLIHATHRAAANQLAISINGGTPTVANWSLGTNSSRQPLYVGRNPINTLQFLTGQLQDVVILKGHAMTDAERVEDYHGGAGMPFAAWRNSGWVYTIYDGPRLLSNGMYYWAYAGWRNARAQQANQGEVEIRTSNGTLRCDFAEDHLAQIRTDHSRLVVDAQGRATRISDGAKIPLDELTGPASDYEREEFTLSIEEQAATLIEERLARAAARNERGRKVLPIDTSRPEAVEEHLERRRRGK